MFKKIVLILCAFFVTVQAQDTDQQAFELSYQELIYDIGMSLVEQDTICDEASAQNAIINVCQDVDQVAQIVLAFLMMDEEMVEENITTVDQLIDYELSEHHDLAMACIVYLQAHQDVFTIFTQLHPEDVSFYAWYRDMAYLGSLTDESQVQDPGYQDLYQACCYMIEAQIDLGHEFKALA